MKKINIAIVGSSQTAKQYHELIQSNAQLYAQITCICTDKIDASLGVKQVATANELLQDDLIDAFIIASKEAQKDMSILLQTSKPIFCANSIASDLKITDSLLQVNFYKRFDNNYQALKEQTQTLGRIRHTHLTSRYTDINTLEHDLLTKTIHDFDMLYHLTQTSIKTLYASLSADAKSLFINMRLANGFFGVISNTFGSPMSDHRAEVFGDNGVVYIDNEYESEVYLASEEGVQKNKICTFQDRFTEANVEQLAHFIEHTRDGRNDTKSVRQNEQALLAIEALQLSLNEKKVVTL